MLTDDDRTKVWNGLPEEMREEIAELYSSFFITFKTVDVLEKIFLRKNLNSLKHQNEKSVER